MLIDLKTFGSNETSQKLYNPSTLHYQKQNNKLRGFSPPANYIDRATAACRRN
jgi:hypothetical protein